MKTAQQQTKILVFLTCVALLVWGCEKKADAPAETAGATAQPAQEAQEAQPASDKVEVSKEGTEFKPPIAKDKLPAGVFYCDMEVLSVSSQHA